MVVFEMAFFLFLHFLGSFPQLGSIKWLESENADGVCGLDGRKVCHALHRYHRSFYSRARHTNYRYGCFMIFKTAASKSGCDDSKPNMPNMARTNA